MGIEIKYTMYKTAIKLILTYSAGVRSGNSQRREILETDESGERNWDNDM